MIGLNVGLLNDEVMMDRRGVFQKCVVGKTHLTEFSVIYSKIEESYMVGLR